MFRREVYAARASEILEVLLPEIANSSLYLQAKKIAFRPTSPLHPDSARKDIEKARAGVVAARFRMIFLAAIARTKLRSSKLSMAQTQLAQVKNDVLVQLSAAYDKAEETQQLVRVT